MPSALVRTAAALLLLLALPVLVVVGLLVWADIGRPVLFRQIRSGLEGRPFEMIKFRTMSMERDNSGNLLPDDRRQKVLGRLLRRLRLDELPELLNVVRGEVAMVGPRPLLPETVAAMGDRGRRRGVVAPGLTGLAQVSGNTLLSDAEKIDLDLWYVAHRSAWLDLRILLRTPLMLLLGERRHQRRLATARAEGANR